MLSLRNISRAFDHQPVLRGIDLEVGRGEILCLLGPSGCGKTTLLRIVAGLERADTGDVFFDGQSIRDVPVHERGFGLMFQDFALFPHLDVAGNVRFGLRMHHLPTDQQRQRTQDALELVGLSGFERRDVTRLSGGERQRVALARSLAPNPRLLMLDEPLGSLDAALRERLVLDVRAIIKRVGLTALYVTHDQQEAFAIADRVAVMNAGRIEQVDRPETVYRRPETVFVAHFLGLNNIFPVLQRENGQAQTAVGNFSINACADVILLHPDGLSLTTEPTPNDLSGQIEECVFLGDSYRIGVRIGNGTALTMKAPAFSGQMPGIGDRVSIQFTPEAIVPLRE